MSTPTQQEIVQEVTVIAKCPKCKKKKEYVMPITFTPFCDKCLYVPMIVQKVIVKNK